MAVTGRLWPLLIAAGQGDEGDGAPPRRFIIRLPLSCLCQTHGFVCLKMETEQSTRSGHFAHNDCITILENPNSLPP